MVIPWCTSSHVSDRIPQLTAVLTSAGKATADLDRVIGEASGMAQAYLRRLYGSQYASWGTSPPEEVQGAVADLAACGVAKMAPGGVPYDVLCEGAAAAALKFLQAIGKGDATLDLPSQPNEEAQVAQITTTAYTPVFDPRGPVSGW